MNKVITINLGGTAYQLEEGGYDLLRNYLESAAARLQGNPDRDEILCDIEGAIGEKFRALLSNHKTVVVTKEVSAVLAEMGPIEADAETAAGASAQGSPGGTKPGQEDQYQGGGAPRRLYRIEEGAMIAGVCNGIAAYLNTDPTFVRLAFVLLTIFWGTGVLIYFVMALVVPEARSPEEKAAASGFPSTAQEFIRRAKTGYYEAMKNFPDRKARRAWQRQFRRHMRAQASHWRYNWHGYWSEQTRLHPGMTFALPAISLLQGVAMIACVCGLISLLATGALFGIALPASVPVWVAALVLFFAYAIVSGPLKIARRMCYWSCGQPRVASSFALLADGLIWVAVLAALAWLAVHYFPQVRAAVDTIPSLAQQAANDIRNWWHQKP